MSYAQRGDGSDVYVYVVADGFECNNCLLGESHHIDTDAILEHLRVHQATGHSVPVDAFDRIERDRDENERFFATGEWPL